MIYSPERIRNGFTSLVEIVCPCCHDASCLVYHASYEKYYYAVRIVIIRLMCMTCVITHAVIPSFSLPGTIVGTAETEAYIGARAQGLSIRRAGRVFFEKGMTVNYPYHFEKMITRGVVNMKALLPDTGTPYGDAYAYLGSLCGNPEAGLILTANRTCLEKSINAVFCNRISILVFSKRKPGMFFPHNPVSPQDDDDPLDSS